MLTIEDDPLALEWMERFNEDRTKLPSCSCPEIDGHESHVWIEEHVGIWLCRGNDGSVQVGQRRWFYSLSDPPPGERMTRHKIVLEVKEYVRGSFLCEIVENDGHPQLDVGYYPVYRDRESITHDRAMDDV